jgi:hypothetical protein
MMSHFRILTNKNTPSKKPVCGVGTKRMRNRVKLEVQASELAANNRLWESAKD